MPEVVTEEDYWPFQPKDIALFPTAGTPFNGALSPCEVELDAARIIRFCKVGGRWTAFTAQEIRAHSLANEGTTKLGVFDFGHHDSPSGKASSLILCGFVVYDGNDRWRVTDSFINLCYRASRGEKVELPASQPELQSEPPSASAPQKVVPGAWKHFSGSIVEVIGIAVCQDQSLVELERFVVYYPQQNDAVYRPLSAFRETDFLEQFSFLAPPIE